MHLTRMSAFHMSKAKLKYISRKKVFWVVQALFICLMISSGCDLISSKGYLNPDDLTVLNFEWQTDAWGNRFVAGALENNSDTEYSYVEVEFDLFDKNGVLIGSAFTNINFLQPRSRWDFMALVTDNSASKALLKGVTGF